MPKLVQAQTKSWTGDIDSQWNKAGNWSPAGVPEANDDVLIYANNGQPYPTISQEDVTVSNLQVADYRAGQLTVANGQTLTITDGLTVNSDGTLFIESGGAVVLSGGTFSMAYNNSLIDITTGSFTSDVAISISGNGFNAGGGTVALNASLTVQNSKIFNAETAVITVEGNTTINGTYNGDDGITTFNSQATIGSQGVINLDDGTINFNGSTSIGNNGTANLGSGTANFRESVSVSSSGYLNVQDATVNIQGNANFNSNGNLTVDTGEINVTGNASLSGGGSFDFNNGALNVGGNASFTNGGTVNAGNAQFDLKGDITVKNGGNFNAETSTITFSGGDTQTIQLQNNDINFYNVIITEEGTTLQTDGKAENTITIENNLTVEEGASLVIQNDDNVDIQGNLDNRGNVQSQDPFVYAISTPSLNEVLVTYDQAMDQQTTSDIGNYDINNNISISSVTFDPNNPTKVLLHVSTLSENTEYTLTVNNVRSASGYSISSNHKKRFTPIIDVTYYSRITGSWASPSSWSTESHTGPPASNIPNVQAGEKAIIGNNHTITLGSAQDISIMDTLVVDGTGVLKVSQGDTLILKNFKIGGSGTFILEEGGTISTGASEGLVAEDNNSGSIQTAGRSFSSSANYIYAGNTSQHTGSGLPQNVRDLRLDNSSGLISDANLQVDGTLYLQNGSLIISSGQALIANNKSVENGDLIFQRILAGTPGWRMVSSPVSASYANFLDGTLTQGYPGSELGPTDTHGDSLQPNVLWYEESYEGTDNQRWRAPLTASDPVTAGRGYNLYVFGNIENDNRYNNPLPDTLSVRGLEHEGNGHRVDLKVTYTAEADTGWNLVGNPYGASINWNNQSGWTKTNMDQTIYVWDPDTQSYKTWNGTTGSLGSGIIPPFQAFWVKANTTNSELSVREEAKTFGGSFVGKVSIDGHAEIEVQLTHKQDTSSIFFAFYDDAKVGKDTKDGYYLEPPPGVSTYLEVYSIGRYRNRYNINALPLNFGVPIEIPVSANIFENGEQIAEAVNLHIATMKNLPYSWEVTLVDRESDKTLSPVQGMDYSFRTKGITTVQAASDSTDVLAENYRILADADPSEARFLLRISPGAAGTGLPDNIDLKQNYPNPFNLATTIRFTLPIQNEVTLEVFNILGRKVATLLKNESYQAGLHSIHWDASHFASGTYIYRLTTGEKVITKKMTLIK